MPFDSTPQNTDPVLQRLRDARARLAQGWTQGQEVYRDCHQGLSFCLVGAVRRDNDGYEAREFAITNAALDIVRLILPGQHITGYNDEPNRTLAQVLIVMDAAIRLHEMRTARAVQRALA